MRTCDIGGCEKEAVAQLYKEENGQRCPACLMYDAREEGW